MRFSAGRIEYCNGTKWVAMQPACVQRRSTSAVKCACGFISKAMCNEGEFASGGGGYLISNGALQNSQPIVDDSDIPTGWVISVLDTTGCTINDYTSDGAVTNGSPPQFPIRGSYIAGAAVAVCCK